MRTPLLRISDTPMLVTAYLGQMAVLHECFVPMRAVDSTTMATELVSLETYDSERLEARWDVEDDPTKAVVFCHPHPQQRGTMTAPLMEALTARLVEAGLAVLRFNFRGVGTSTGIWDSGVGEIHDVAAAVDHAEMRGLPMSICGWSFGGAISLRWQAVARSELTWVGIAPPVPPRSSVSMPGPEDLQSAKRTIIIGDRDQLIDVEDARVYAAALGAEFHVLNGSDHFFHFREDQVGKLLVPALQD